MPAQVQEFKDISTQVRNLHIHANKCLWLMQLGKQTLPTVLKTWPGSHWKDAFDEICCASHLTVSNTKIAAKGFVKNVCSKVLPSKEVAIRFNLWSIEVLLRVVWESRDSVDSSNSGSSCNKRVCHHNRSRYFTTTVWALPATLVKTGND